MTLPQSSVSEPASELQTPKKVAIIGSGPASIGAADVLSASGVAVTIFEARSYFGGVLTYGIPKFRLPKGVVEAKRKELVSRGVDIKLNCRVRAGGQGERGAFQSMANNGVQSTQTERVTFEELQTNYDAVFIGNGADLPKSAGIRGENLQGVLQGLDFLEEINTTPEVSEACDTFKAKFKGLDVLVIGGGNVAMDVAGTAVRCGAKSVTITYRRSMEELPAREEEIKLNQAEGVQFKLLTSPVEVLGDEQGKVRGLLAQEVVLGEPDKSGRRQPICKLNSEFEIPADVVILAIGSDQDVELLERTNLALDNKGHLIVDDFGRTSIERVYAGGDNVTGPLTVVSAMKQGRAAALAILEDIFGH